LMLVFHAVAGTLLSGIVLCLFPSPQWRKWCFIHSSFPDNKASFLKASYQRVDGVKRRKSTCSFYV
ncbi:MAG: hypothetical protein ACPGVP_22375, partial [Thiolinea sp.]